MFADGNQSRALNRVDRRQAVERRQLDWSGEGGGGGNYKGDERRVDRVGKNRREEERVSFDNRGKMSDVDMRIITKKKR